MIPPRASRLLFLHARLATALGLPCGVVDVPALAAALDAATTASGDLFEQAADLMTAFACQRPFHAANLPFAAAAAALFLREYDLDLQLTPADAPTLRDLLRADDPTPLAAWLRAHTVPRPLE
jgi:prophage maintenance system killer protein